MECFHEREKVQQPRTVEEMVPAAEPASIVAENTDSALSTSGKKETGKRIRRKPVQVAVQTTKNPTPWVLCLSRAFWEGKMWPLAVAVPNSLGRVNLLSGWAFYVSMELAKTHLCPFVADQGFVYPKYGQRRGHFFLATMKCPHCGFQIQIKLKVSKYCSSQFFHQIKFLTCIVIFMPVLFKEDPDKDPKDWLCFDCLLFGERNETAHTAQSGAAKRKVRRTVPKTAKERIGKEMLEKACGNQDMKTEMLDRADWNILDSGNFSACLSDNQLKVCRQLAKKNRNITRGSQMDCAAIIRQLAREIRDPLTLHHGFVFDFKWDPLSALLTSHSLMDLFIKACVDIGERFRLHLDSTGEVYT